MIRAASLSLLFLGWCCPEEPAPEAGVCTAELACPEGSYSTCESIAEPVSCCRDGQTDTACQAPAGILTHACPEACAYDLCAVAGDGGFVCCDFDAKVNPCAIPVEGAL